MSDGECDEGTTWESALIASQFNLDNLIVLVDRNRLQSFGDTEKTISLEPFKSKWESFGWDVHNCDGHSHVDLSKNLLTAKSNANQNPKIIICDTIKGKGVSFMENQVVWHYRPPNEEQLAQALAEIEASK
jgi:transketolase